MKELGEEEKRPKHTRKTQEKRRAKEHLTFEEGEMAAVMGFSGFGSTKKSCQNILFGLNLAYTGPNFECVLRWGWVSFLFFGHWRSP